MIRKNIVITIFMIMTLSVHADETDIISKLTDILSQINQTKSLKDKNIEQEKQELRSASEQVSEVMDNSEQFISNNLPNINVLNSNDSQMRDPFNLANQSASGLRQGGFNFGSSFLPDINNTKVPSIKLRGVIQPPSKKSEDLLALLEVDNKETYMVRVGDEISYDPRRPNAALKIISISRLTVTVQAGSLGNVLVVR